MTVSSLLGRRIKEMRDERGFSQSALAEKAMIAQSTLSYIESGKKSPTFETLQAICGGLNMSLLELLKFDDKEAAVRSVEAYEKQLRNSLSEEDLRQLLDLSSFAYKKIGAE